MAQETQMAKSTIVWFEIPVKDMKRAMKFYSKVLGVELQEIEFGPSKMVFFPHSAAEGTVSGALVLTPDNSPSEKGPLVYLNGGEDLSTPLGRVEAAGGKILLKKMSIGEHGFIATFRDTEGNRIAFHSMK